MAQDSSSSLADCLPSSDFALGDVSLREEVLDFSCPSSSSCENTFDFIGTHLLASYMDCNLEALLDHQGLINMISKAVVASGATVLKVAEHIFEGGGMTVAVVLAESHASLHTYPEHASCFVDIFTCGDSCKPEEFDRVLSSYLKPQRTSKKILSRGQEVVELSIC